MNRRKNSFTMSLSFSFIFALLFYERTSEAINFSDFDESFFLDEVRLEFRVWKQLRFILKEHQQDPFSWKKIKWNEPKSLFTGNIHQRIQYNNITSTKREEWKITILRCASGGWNICLLRISQVINIKNGEQWNAATLSSFSRLPHSVIHCGVVFLPKITFLTAIVSLKSSVGRTEKSTVSTKTGRIVKLQRFSDTFCWRFHGGFDRSSRFMRALSAI